MPLTSTLNPPIDGHVSPAPPDPPEQGRSGAGSRRGRPWAPIAAAVALFGVLAGAGAAGAFDEGIRGAATAEVPAERVLTTGDGMLFPIDPASRCLVFNNFGGFSKTFGSRGHQGVDIGADLGQEVYAVENGVLSRQFTELDSAAGLGWSLLGVSDTQYRYYHLSAFAAGLEEGDLVTAGDLIGYVGDTGNATPGGWHLHFEVRPGPRPHDEPVDPVPLLDVPRTCTVYPRPG